MKKVLLKIGGMTCSACSSGLEKYLNKQDGIKVASVKLVMNNASIEYDDDKLMLADVEKFVEKAGFESLGIDNLEREEKRKSGEKIKLWLISIFSILTIYISMAHMIGLPDIPFLSMMIYPLNYGFIPNVFGGDGEELDVYLMGLNVPVKEYKAKVIAIVHRHNDVEDKLVAAPEGMSFTKMEIEDAVRFQEQYFESEIEIL